MGFRRGLRLLWAVPVVGAALAAGWMFGARSAENSSLTEGPATAPARLEEGTGRGPEPLVEAETAERSVQSARDEETNPIRVDGPEPRAVGGAADGLIGHQVAETLGAGLFGVDFQGKQRGAVEHLCVAQNGDFFCRQPLPQAELFQQVLGGVGEGDLAAVEFRFA